jgi:hypothetical protein
VDDPWATVEAAARDRSSGAAEIARKAADALGLLSEHRVMAAIELLLRGHPSMAPLWRLASDVLSLPDRALAVRHFGAALEGERGGLDALGPRVAGRRLLTISYSSSVVELVRLARPQTVLCMRSEPGGEGAHAAEAMSVWTKATVIEDEDAITNVPSGAVVVGADAVTPRAVINKMKTTALAEAAGRKGIRIYVVAGEFKFVGDELPVAPVFEATQLELFSAIAGPQGLWDASQTGTHARSRRIHPELRPLLNDLLREFG